MAKKTQEKSEKKVTKKKTTPEKKASVKKGTKKSVKKTAKKTVKKTGMTAQKSVRRTKRDSRKTNLTKLCKEMNKHVVDANDREIIKRIRKLIDSAEDDIARPQLDTVLKEPEKVEINTFHEGLQPFIRHYLFMLKRAKNRKEE